VAIGLDLRIARVIRAAVDHALAHAVHLGRVHVGQPGDELQRLGRDRHGVVASRGRLRRAGRGRRGWRRSCRGKAVPRSSVTVRGLSAGKSARRSERCASPSRRMRFSPISRVIRPFGLARGEDLDPFFLPVDVGALRQQNGAAQLRHPRHGRLGAHPYEIGVGIGPEGHRVDVDDGCVHAISSPGPMTARRRAAVKRDARGASAAVDPLERHRDHPVLEDLRIIWIDWV
jgi:hypothetical protein